MPDSLIEEAEASTDAACRSELDCFDGRLAIYEEYAELLIG